MHQRRCDANPDLPPDGEAKFSLKSNMEEVSLQVSGYGARCSQELCAFVHKGAQSVDVLIQPCDLHPRMVARCSCAHDLTIPLGVVEQGVAIVVYERDDECTTPTKAEKVRTLRLMVAG